LDHEVETLLRDLRKNYRVIAFSGNVRSRVEFLDKRYGFRKLFDAEVWSYDSHYNKPSVEFLKARARTRTHAYLCVR
jgi:FMN phosphatase YigB (HAD superfamily)